MDAVKLQNFQQIRLQAQQRMQKTAKSEEKAPQWQKVLESKKAELESADKKSRVSLSEISAEMGQMVQKMFGYSASGTSKMQSVNNMTSRTRGNYIDLRA